MKKTIIIGLIFLLMINIASAQELYTKEPDACKIIVKDYMQEYVDYSCEVLNLTSYKLNYKVNDQAFFEMINNCTFDDDNCIDEIAKSKSKTIKDFDKDTKEILGLGGVYNYDEFLDNYFSKKTKLEQKVDIEKLKLWKEFPIEYLTENINHDGEVRPFNHEGSIIVDVEQKSYNKIKIGYGSVIIEFNNSETSENLDMYKDNGGFGYFNYTRYLDVSKFLILNESSININGFLDSAAPFYEYDYFVDDDTSNWNYQNNTAIGAGADTLIITLTEDVLKSEMTGQAAYLTTSTYDMICNTGNCPSLTNASDWVVLSKFNYSNYCTVSGGDGDATQVKSQFGFITNSYNIIFENLLNCDNTNGAGATQTNKSSEEKIFKIYYNSSNSKIYIYNETSLLSSTTYAFTNLYLTFNVSTYGNIGVGFGSFALIENVLLGYTTNTTEGINWDSSSQSYPKDVKIFVGGDNIYTGTGNLTTETQLNFTSELMSIWDSCNCDRCVDSTDKCIIPVDFYSENGGVLNYSKINITYTPAAANISVNIYDSDTLNKINTTNITLQIIGEQYQTELITDDGNASFQFFFNTLEPDTVSIRAFSTDIQDYSIISRNIIISNSNETTELDLYLTNTSDTTKSLDVQFITVDEAMDRLENGLIKVYKQNPSTNEDLLLTEMYSKSDGQASTKLIGETVFYKFVVEYQGETVYISQNAVSISEEDIPIRLNCILRTAYSEYFRSVLDLDASLFFTKTDNETGYYSITHDSKKEYEICFNDYYVINTVRINSTNYCTNSTSGSMSFAPISVSQFANVYGNVQVDFKLGNGKENYLRSHEYLGLDDLSRSRSSRLIIYFAFILICGIAFLYAPTVGLVIFALGTLLISFTKFILLTPGISMLIVSLTVFVIITYNKKK